ncbi:SDR family oxidoreductase [Mycolicibacterium gadium]|uniref:SDR family oxidoreductase n=1 Tax=Mycolicibacterium gadium TaxID=1794 RepID=UPI0013D0238B|nr:SDR family oxidoreductase [Mycolicibacterium gadium]
MGHPVTVCVLGAAGGLAQHIAAEFDTSAIGLDDELPNECDGVIVVVGESPGPAPRPIKDMSESEWRDTAETAAFRVMRVFQRARVVTLARRGNIVVVAPSIGLVGGPELSHYVSGIEAIRALAKSAARQWAPEQISVNLIVVPLELVAGGVGELARHVGSAARKDADLADAVVRAVKFLLSGAGPGLTGSTLVVDGGAVMVP